jgi:hypothetical protein
MKKYFILFLVFISCKNENHYETALKQYLKEDLGFKQARIDYQLEDLKFKSMERPREYHSLYKDALFFNNLFVQFEKDILKTETTDSINLKFKSLKKTIKKEKHIYSKFIITELDKFPFPIESSIQKHKLLRNLKILNYKVNNRNLISLGGCNFTKSHPHILATRLNDSIVLLNIYSEMIKDYTKNFDNESITINNIEDNNKNKIDILKQFNDITESYFIKSKSDTLYLDATIKTVKEPGLLVAKNNSFIIVGQPKDFDKNNLKEYFKYY